MAELAGDVVQHRVRGRLQSRIRHRPSMSFSRKPTAASRHTAHRSHSTVAMPRLLEPLLRTEHSFARGRRSVGRSLGQNTDLKILLSAAMRILLILSGPTGNSVLEHRFSITTARG